MKRYNPKDIEPRWQKDWSDKNLYQAVDFDKTRTKYVMLTEFPYPSGDGLHVGHAREYTLGDIMARHKRMDGYNVLYPMGYDAFGLPTENYAIKNKIAPQVATDQNTANFQKQFEALGLSVDWSRSFRTTDPDYYKWTQWLFLQFLKAGLAYRDKISINWCPKCKTGLANEEVVNGKHERCGTPVEKKTLNQWMLKITAYADKLIDGLGRVDIDYPSRIADQQINWIGRSKGAEIDFKLDGHSEVLRVFTTRPDTLFGATFMVLAPEHPLVAKITTDDQKPTVDLYIKLAQGKSEIERQDTNREKTGVFTGAYAVNPANNQKIPIWIADYVLTGYGTGAIMAVPAHDERDFEFAKKFDLPIKQVVSKLFIDKIRGPVEGKKLIKRDTVHAVVKHPTEQKLLLLYWTIQKGYTHIIGGIEEGETPEQAARREIVEETGYKNLKFIENITEQTQSQYYAEHKDINRHSLSRGVIFQLQDLEQDPISAAELKIHRPEWVDYDHVLDNPVGADLEIFFEAMQKGYQPFVGEGVMVNSGAYDGLSSSEARDKIVADLAKQGAATEKINYRLHDWIFSRQHYWGEPIPVIHCPTDGIVPVPEDQLPVVLPPVDNYEPTDNGESPLAAITDWVNTICPTCGKPAKRETDTMPNWAGSSWYYLRYYDAHNTHAFADRKKLEYWGAVDMYLGGMEHTTLHLLYSRFWHQFFYDQGLVPTPEPYKARRGQGIILSTDGTKMSKSKGNVINPLEIVDQGYGADALRLYIAFIAPFDQTTPWNPEGVAGTFRFLQRVWTLSQEFLDTQEVGKQNKSTKAALLHLTHKTIKKVSQDLHTMGFNTAVAALMEMTNELYKLKAKSGFADTGTWQFALATLVQLLAPSAPHITEELWQQLGQNGSVHVSKWPLWDEKYLITDNFNIVVQVNGKVRAQIDVPADASKEVVLKAAKANPKVAGYLKGQTIKKEIYVPGKLVSLVV
jgi:leucyl-tRNA synthetase